MDAAALEVLGILMRWFHIASVAIIVGGVVYARVVAFPALRQVSASEAPSLFEHLTLRYRPLIYGAAVSIVVSGLYNFLAHRGHTRYYHMWFGIKMLLVAHVIAVALLLVQTPTGKAGDQARRERQMTGVVISGLAIILISAYLRRIF